MYSEFEATGLIIEAGRRLVSSGLVARTWGNISARTLDDAFMITPSGRTYDSLRPEDIVKVRISDLSYEGDIRPSSEKAVHAAAYALRPDIDFIVHTHQYYATAVAADCRDIDAAPCADYALPGSRKLMKNVERAIRNNPGHNAFLMARHGALILGKNMDESFGLANELERGCRDVFAERVTDISVPDITASVPYLYPAGSSLAEKIRISTGRHAVIASDPYITRCCGTGGPLEAYVDDFAQMAGPWVECVSGDEDSIAEVLMHGAAVLASGVGAVCTGDTMDDAMALAAIVSKNAACRCYVRNAGSIPAEDALLQRQDYLDNYSKQKDMNYSLAG